MITDTLLINSKIYDPFVYLKIKDDLIYGKLFGEYYGNKNNMLIILVELVTFFVHQVIIINLVNLNHNMNYMNYIIMLLTVSSTYILFYISFKIYQIIKKKSINNIIV